MAIKSYGLVGNPVAKVVNYLRLIEGASRSMADLPNYVRRIIDECAALESMVSHEAAIELRGLRALEIGAGQLPRQMMYFARRNSVVGIDLDYVPPELGIAGYITMLRTNGAGRVIKTIGRKALGFDRRMMRELSRQLGCDRPPSFERLQMDAGRMSFADESFDLVYSVDVFEHLSEPAAVLDEVVRVLRPGGAALVSLLPYTSEAGPHDLRTHGGPRHGLPYWAHLRPRLRNLVEPSVYVNGMASGDWIELVKRKMPGAAFNRSMPSNAEELASELARLRSAGELLQYADEDLLSYRLRFCWRKPPSSHHSGTEGITS
jgi:SAM-dependent methyltransferase